MKPVRKRAKVIHAPMAKPSEMVAAAMMVLTAMGGEVGERWSVRPMKAATEGPPKRWRV